LIAQSAKVTGVSEDNPPFLGGRAARRAVSVNQLVGYNMKWFREKAGLTQAELGQRLGGWSKGVVSAAERSWDSDRIRQFDADEIVAIAEVLDVPVIALLLPPPDSGTVVDYTFEADPAQMNASDLLRRVITDYQGDSKAMAAFRNRISQVGATRFMESIQKEADRIFAQARDAAQQLLGESRDHALALQHDAEERYRQAITNLVPQAEQLERRIDDLRAFEREYRTRQIEYHEGMLRDLRAGQAGDDVFPALSRPPGSEQMS
jgi:transcriptional regulator with XRE-family HTH domain